MIFEVPAYARDRVVHLISAHEVDHAHGMTVVAVCGELVTSGPDDEEDPNYCPECVRAAIRWSAQPVAGDRHG